MNSEKTDDYYHNKNNLDDIWRSSGTEHYIGKFYLSSLIDSWKNLDPSRKKGIAIVCIFVAIIAFYFIGKQYIGKSKNDLKEDRGLVSF